MSDNININSSNEYAECNNQSCHFYQSNQSFLSHSQSVYYTESILFEYTDEDYTEEEYTDKYDYNYEEDIYHKKDSKKNSNFMIDVTASALNVSDCVNESVYHINTFHAHISVINVYFCCMYKTTFTSNNKLHCHIHLTYSKIKKKIKTKKTKTLSSEQKLKNISIAIHMNLISIKNINSIFTDINVDHISIVESDIKNQINESDCKFCN